MTTFDELIESATEKLGQRSFISRIENEHSDIQLSTLFKLIELGLGRKVSCRFDRTSDCVFYSIGRYRVYITVSGHFILDRDMRLIVILTFISTQTFGQWIGSDEIDASGVQSWIPKLTIEYQGVYRFGDSENESDLLVFFSNGKVVGQIRSGSWSTVDNSLSWILSYQNLNDIKIEDNKFSSSKASGEFVIYDNGTEKLKGLKITNPWSGIPESGQWEIGLRRGNVNDFLSGKFIQASLRQLDKNELVQLDNSELRLMRNEIFARYGLKFKTGGEMDTYFMKQTWYRRQHDNVDKFLTDVEKENIRTIQEVENR